MTQNGLLIGAQMYAWNGPHVTADDATNLNKYITLLELDT